MRTLNDVYLLCKFLIKVTTTSHPKCASNITNFTGTSSLDKILDLFSPLRVTRDTNTDSKTTWMLSSFWERWGHVADLNRIWPTQQQTYFVLMLSQSHNLDVNKTLWLVYVDNNLFGQCTHWQSTSTNTMKHLHPELTETTWNRSAVKVNMEIMEARLWCHQRIFYTQKTAHTRADVMQTLQNLTNVTQIRVAA